MAYSCSVVRLDQRVADDFLFNTLTKSALIGMVALIFLSAFWQMFLAYRFGDMPGFAVLLIALEGWALGYLYTRIQGTRA